MADVTVFLPGPTGPIKLLAHDNGDGTYSLATYGGGGSGGSISGPLDRRADAQAVSVALSTEDVALLTALLTQSDFDTKVGALTEAAPASDTASSGLNGRLQRIAQNITTLIGSLLTVVGNVAHDGVDSGNPVKVGGKANSSAPSAVSAGDRVDQWLTLNGATVVAPVSATSFTDGTTTVRLFNENAGSNVLAGVVGGLFNNTNFDRPRNTNALTLLASAARTTNTNSADQVNYNWKGLLLTVDVSSAGTGSITPTIQTKDSISGNYKTIWTAAAALVANGTAVYAFYPGSPALGSLTFTELVAAFVGRTWRLGVTHNNANSITYSASADALL